MAPVRPHLLPGIALLFTLVAVLPAVLGDRSPYVPDPVTYPGLLPQFTSTTVAPTAPGGGAQHQRPVPSRPASTSRPQAENRPKPTTTTQRVTTAEEVPAEEEDNGLGDRIGEERPQRPDGQQRPQRPGGQQRPQRPCDGQGAISVPCYDCVVYISRTGTITRFYPRETRDD